MIQSKEDYRRYIEADRIALGITRKHPRPWADEEWRFERVLRAYEYALNCRRGILTRPLRLFRQFHFHRLSVKFGYTIPPNVFGPGLSIAHRGPIIVNPYAKVGANCRIHVGVTIGTSPGYGQRAPIIGDNVFIGPGVKIYGDITVGNGIAIAPNTVVNRSFKEPDVTLGGVPALVIARRGSEGHLV